MFYVENNLLIILSCGDSAPLTPQIQSAPLTPRSISAFGNFLLNFYEKQLIEG
jgi:hypothetical protein